MTNYAVIFPQLKQKVSYLFGEGVNLSYPLPDIVNGIRVDRFFLYPAGLQSQRSRPFGLLTVEMESGRILGYRDCALEDFVDQNAHPLQERIDYRLPVKMGMKDFRVNQSLIGKLYEVVRERAFAEDLTEQDKVVIVKYVMLLEKLTPRALAPYYLAMGRNFYDWGF